MSRIGIDFGTTRTIVALADHGNYPLAMFEDEAGDALPFFPSVLALVDGELVAGHRAVAAMAHGAPACAASNACLHRPASTWAETLS